ncbi:type I restriction enzyme HsdR N-terminal domain-containing protein [Yoonia sp. I 8.24]|nr:type I restriction endonuclease [Yoonia sp. I 8.24]MCG3269510.1 type I restriction enzyme HsdR N-terminal domain-containing protein [Yoonia sp. I 8.24]
MEFTDRIKDLSKRSKQAFKIAQTEEATKTSVILPLIQALGFDPFNLEEVVPEFVADVGMKKGEKVDFALRIKGHLSALIEVKPISMELGKAQFDQLFRYFGVTEARLAILTNGRDVWFFSDLDAANRMDKKPFFRFDLQSYDENQLQELSKFQKDNFSIENIVTSASNLKYQNDATNYLKRQLSDPDEDFVRLIGRNIHDGTLTKSVVEQITPAVQTALDGLIRDRIQDKLSVTFGSETAKSIDEPKQVEPTSDIVTTDEEIQAFMIVQAIAAKAIPVDRVTMRDAKSYCSVFVDDINRKPVCRFYFNAKSVKHVGFFDADKQETKIEITNSTDIYMHQDRIVDVVTSYL